MRSQREQKVVSPQLSIKLAEEKDCDLLWRWRNEADTQNWSFNSGYITYEEHKQWFLDKLHSTNTKILIILNNKREEIGQVRFDITGDRASEIGISIDSKRRNKRYGSSALMLACRYAFEKFGIVKVIAHIKTGNQASINAFANAGFIDKGEQDFKGHKAIKMMWTCDQSI